MRTGSPIKCGSNRLGPPETNSPNGNWRCGRLPDHPVGRRRGDGSPSYASTPKGSTRRIKREGLAVSSDESQDASARRDDLERTSDVCVLILLHYCTATGIGRHDNHPDIRWSATVASTSQKNASMDVDLGTVDDTSPLILLIHATFWWLMI